MSSSVESTRGERRSALSLSSGSKNCRDPERLDASGGVPPASAPAGAEIKLCMPHEGARSMELGSCGTPGVVRRIGISDTAGS